MNRKFYLYAIFFAVLITTCGILQSVIYLLLNGQMYGLDSFSGWFLTSNITYVVASVYIVQYYRYKKYRFTFAASIFHIIAILFLFIVFYKVINARAINRLYIPAVFFSLTAGVLYAITLIYSKAGERAWLKKAGISILILGIIYLSDALWYLNSHDDTVKASLNKIRPWLSVVGSLIPVLLIMNFRQEMRDLKPENVNANQHKFYYSMLGVLSVIAVVLAMFFGVIFAREAYSSVYRGERNFEKTQKMAEQCGAQLCKR